MEWKIGEIFEFEGEWYQCIPDTTDDNCNNCFFQKRCSNITGDCSSTARSDGKSVAFKKLEKIGEPYKLGKVLIQQYQGLAPVILPKNSECSNIFRVISSINVIEIEIKQPQENMEEYRMHDAKEDIPEFDKVVDECLFGEDKLNLKPFDLEAAKAGKPVCTRDGRNARIICFDAKCADTPIIALVSRNDGEILLRHYKDGKLSVDKDSDADLMMLSEKKEGWIVVRRSDIYENEEEARETLLNSYEAMMLRNITWEE